MNTANGAFAYSGKDNLEAMRHATQYNAFLADLVARETRRGQRVLDFGAGLGVFAEALRARGANVACIEVDPVLSASLASRGFDCFGSPAELPDESFDFVYSLNVLEHIDDDVAALTALRPKLHPAGRCLIYVPAFPVLFGNMDRLVGHHRRYTRSSLVRVLTQAGFETTHVEYVDSLGFAASLAHRAIGASGTISPQAVSAYDRWVFPASRILDRLAKDWVGKNVFALARAR